MNDQINLTDRIFVTKIHRPMKLGTVAFRLDVPSDTKLIKDVISYVKRHLGLVEYPVPVVEFDIPLALTEAMANAMIHGNGRDYSKTVRIFVKIAPSRFYCVVTDKGRGFNHTNLVPLRESETEPLSSGRGVHLIRCLMSEVSFNSVGNQIRMKLNV